MIYRIEIKNLNEDQVKDILKIIHPMTWRDIIPEMQKLELPKRGYEHNHRTTVWRDK